MAFVTASPNAAALELDSMRDESDNDEWQLQFQEEMQQMGEDILDAEFDEEAFDEVEDHVTTGGDLFLKLLNSAEPHKDQRTMKLTPEERQWAVDLKRTAQEDHAELQTLSDFEYAHYALFCKGNVEEGIMRMTAMQSFREEYQVDNSVEQMLQIIQAFLTQQPGLFLHLDVDPVTMEGFHVLDFGAVDIPLSLAPCPINGVDHNWRIFVCGFYYWNMICQPCLATVKAGNHALVDFATWSWSHLATPSLEIHYRMTGALLNPYPLRFSKFKCYNSGQTANVFFSLVKKLYPGHLIDNVLLGCHVSPTEGGRTLRETFLQPTMEVAYERMLVRAKDLLSLRFKNQELFRL